MFESTNNCPIYVPIESLEAYKTAQYWSDYATRIRANPSSSVPVPEAVDLGLPSGLKWASFNLGASKPEECGEYYAWGDVEPKSYYDWSTYKWCMGSNTTMTKYCQNAEYGYEGFTDDKTVLDPVDDAAHVNLGGKWRMPTDADITELLSICIWEQTSMNGINGRKATGPNGNSIFFPLAGGRSESHLYDVGTYSYYLSSSPHPDLPSYAWGIYLSNSDVLTIPSVIRCGGNSIRPVCD
jgi:hypothetical protein